MPDPTDRIAEIAEFWRDTSVKESTAGKHVQFLLSSLNDEGEKFRRHINAVRNFLNELGEIYSLDFEDMSAPISPQDACSKIIEAASGSRDHIATLQSQLEDGAGHVRALHSRLMDGEWIDTGCGCETCRDCNGAKAWVDSLLKREG